MVGAPVHRPLWSRCAIDTGPIRVEVEPLTDRQSDEEPGERGGAEPPAYATDTRKRRS